MIVILYLGIFILGGIFLLCIFPILQAFTDLMLAWVESIKYSLSLRIAQKSEQIQKIQESQGAAQPLIGFDISDEGACFDNEEDEVL